MSVYVMSDIHGCFSEFQQMLAKIQFDNACDELIIAGDIIDRGTENRKMLDYVCSKPENVVFLMGNHDYDFICYCNELINLYSNGKITCDLIDIFNDKEIEHIYKLYVLDKYQTIEKLIKEGAILDNFRKWSKKISKFKYLTTRYINNKKYIIVHAGFIHQQELDVIKKKGIVSGYNDIETFYIWARSEGVKYGGENNATVIFGHTPTISDTYFNNNGKVYIEERKNRRFINIDCGYVWKEKVKDANLACIRLDDEKVFYLN
jgi:serine/threonine protein phosphatase 1